MSKIRCEQAEEHLLRVRNVVDLASLMATDAFENGWPDQLEDFLGYGKRHDSMVHLWELLEITEPEDATRRLHDAGFHGILMEVGTPVRKYRAPVTESQICSYSWGHMYLGWVYGETYEAAWEEAIDWAQQREADDLATALKKKGGAA